MPWALSRNVGFMVNRIAIIGRWLFLALKAVWEEPTFVKKCTLRSLYPQGVHRPSRAPGENLEDHNPDLWKAHHCEARDIAKTVRTTRKAARLRRATAIESNLFKHR